MTCLQMTGICSLDDMNRGVTRRLNKVGTDIVVRQAKATGMGWVVGMLLGSTALMGLVASPLQAQTAQAPNPAAQGQTRSFNIAPQPLSSALRQFSEQSGLQFAYSSEEVQGIASPGVSGSHAPEAALNLLLHNTGVIWRYTAQNTISVVRAPQSSGQAVLPPVTVQGNAQRAETAWGPVEGYVATRSATGSKTDTPLIETPHSISVITREQMADQGVLSLEQAIAYTPGVTVATFGDDPRYDQFNLRGFGANTNAMYLDGLRQWGASFAYPQNEPYGLEKIGVIRGPASVLYGQIAPGGLVEGISKRPLATPFNEVMIQGGTNEHKQGQFDMSGPLDANGQVLYRLTGLLRDAETELDEPDDRKFIAPAITLRNDSTSLTLLAQYQEYQTGNWPYYYANGSDVSRVWVGDPNFNKFDLTQYHIGYLLEHRLNDTWALRQNFRWGRVTYDAQYVSVDSVAGNILTRGAGITRQDLTNYAVDNQAQADFDTGPVKHTLLGGLGYDRMYYDYRAGYGGGGSAPSLNLNAPVYGYAIATPVIDSRSRQTLDQLGVYMQEQAKIGQLALTFGGRLDRAESETKTLTSGARSVQDDRKFTYKAGATYLFDSGIAPYISYAESFQPQAGVDRLSRSFEPTTGAQTEAGVKYQPPGRNSFVTLAAFDLARQNVLTPDPVNTNFSIQTGEVVAQGVEFEAKSELTDNISLISSYTFTDAEVTKANNNTRGRMPVGVPEHMAALWGEYAFKQGEVKGLRLGLGLRYVGTTYANATNTQENAAYTMTDAMLRYDLAGLSPSMQGFELGLNASNLFDVDTAVCNSGTCAWMAGRSVIGSLRYRW